VASPGALGVLETRGVAAQVAAADVMVKAADVRVCGRQGIGSGWVTVVVEGEVAAVQIAMARGESEAGKHGEVIGADVITAPDPALTDIMPHSRGLGRAVLKPRQALGILETRGFAQLVVGGDAAAKAATISVGGWAYAGGALCHLVVQGDVANVRAALREGRLAAETAGEVYAALVIPQPVAAVAGLLPPATGATPQAVGALGILETTGYAGSVASADAMAKTAAIEVARFNIGSGGRTAVMTTGKLDEVQAGIQSGIAAAKLPGGFETAAVVTQPDPEIVACFAQASTNAAPKGLALGLIETRSTVALVKAMDQMLKGADVEYEGRMKVGFYLTAGVIRGDIGAVQVALDLGAAEARRHGELVSTYLIPQPARSMEPSLPHR
jgi:ethanolamine utilization protein EutM